MDGSRSDSAFDFPGSAVLLDPPGSLGVAHDSTPITPGCPAWHDMVYRSAGGDIASIRWADGKANPALVSWLNAEAPARVRPGSRAVVVGCGLGDDVIELINRGYDAIGFDVSPTAIEWARRRFPSHASAFCVADLLALPTRFCHRFELVAEVYTLQSMHPAQREQAAAAVASMVGPRGVLVAIARGRDNTQMLDERGGPPWPLCPTEMQGVFESAGLKPCRAMDDFLDDESPAQRRLRAIFERT